MEIGQIIKEARKSKGLTQEELGELIGVQKSAVAKWENGRVSEIKRTSLNKLAQVLELDPNVLLGTVPKDIAAAEETGSLLAFVASDSDLKSIVRNYINLSNEKRISLKNFSDFLLADDDSKCTIK